MERFGPYELERRVAVGGMAEIFLARRCGPGGFAKRVALKRVLPELARQSDFRDMFADEARLCASLDHPGLVQVFDYGEVDGTPFLAMEWVDGCDLATLLSGGGPLPTPAAAYVMAEVARTLAYVHAARDAEGRQLDVVHRDLSPGNILVSRGGDVKLGDFGVAKARGRLARTEAGQLKGTLAYLAPEQVGGGRIDPRTDVYAVGLLLFELVTGERYLVGDGEVELLKSAANPGPRSAAAEFPGLDVPREIDAVLARALAPEPERRFPNATALELELGKLCPSPGEARALVVRRVCELAGACGDGPRRQTEVVCVEPEPRDGRGRGRRGIVLALAGLLVALVSAGAIWAWVAPSPADPSPAAPGAVAAAAIPRPPSPAPPRPAEAPPRPDTAPRPDPAADAGPGAVSAPADPVTPPDRPRPGPGKTIRPPAPRPAVAARDADVAAAPEPVTPPVVEPAPNPAELLRTADRRRAARGLVAGDDAAADQLRARAAGLVAQGAPATEGARAVDEYLRRVDEVAVDSAFIDRKMQRVSARIRALGADDPRATELDALSREALRRAVAGDYVGANGLLNRIIQQTQR